MELNKNLTIEQWYPNLIGYCDYLDHNKIEKILSGECLSLSKKIKKGGKNWISNKTYNTFNTYSILKNEKFKKLNNWILNKVLEYSNALKYQNKLYCVDAWFNIYKKYDYQEFHDHGSSTLSAVYFLKSDAEKSSKIYFKFNLNDNLMEPTTDPSFNLTSPTVWYAPVPGRLLIFKSTLKHSVERHENNNIRISLAYNFNKVL